jgi:hypothetical protein
MQTLDRSNWQVLALVDERPDGGEEFRYLRGLLQAGVAELKFDEVS